jgi:hypothetical protein
VTEPSSRLWREALCISRGETDSFRDALRVSLAQVRSDADQLADRIAEDFPEFTVHDGNHLDALWPLIDLVSPADLHLTPTEAWTLGVAVILHDLGMAVAAYPGGRNEIRAAPGWPDARAAALRAELGRTPSSEELGTEDSALDLKADAVILRQRHGERAGELVDAQWGESRLVADPVLRGELGSIAGQIAASHSWSTEELTDLGDIQGAPGGMPSDWTVRPVLLAALLRIADAAHLDSSRAPTFGRAIRTLDEIAARHWGFQGKLRQPVLVGDRLRFVSNQSFPVDQASAWWLCLDHLRLLDDELVAADSLLQAQGLPRLTPKSVQGARDPRELAQIVKPDGWEPVDARIEVSKLSNLIRRLGGRALYGDAEAVPLRELIQNASDAVVARRVLQDGFSGQIKIRISTDLTELSVADDGVGMGREVLAGALLDFGRSLWESDELAAVLPGLQAAGFQPAGKFGIGFFSIFMWAEEVTVTSRPRRLGEDETRVLSFPQGLDGRPLIRLAEPNERMPEPGTIVRVKISPDETELRSLFQPRSGEEVSELSSVRPLLFLLRWLAPALEVDLYAAVGEGDYELAVAAGDWRSVPANDLLLRLDPDRPNGSWAHAPRVSFIGTRDKPVGRIALLPGHSWPPAPSTLVAGGLRVGAARHLSGILAVDHLDASRGHGLAAATPEQVSEWATGQAARGDSLPVGEALKLAAMVLHLGGDIQSLPLVESAAGPLSRSALLDWIAGRSEFVFLDVDLELMDARDRQWIPPSPTFSLADGVLNVPSSPRRGDLPPGFVGLRPSSLEDELLRLAAEAWNCSLDGLQTETVENLDLVDVVDADPVECMATAVSRPSASVSSEQA